MFVTLNIMLVIHIYLSQSYFLANIAALFKNESNVYVFLYYQSLLWTSQEIYQVLLSRSRDKLAIIGKFRFVSFVCW